MLKRLTDRREHAMMYTKSNRENMERFEKILPYFFYKNPTNNRILKSLETRDYLDELFKLNDQKRAWFSLENPELVDQSYIRYKKFLKDHEKYGDSFQIEEISKNRVALFDYENFKNNKITIGKQDYKLFKYLKKKDLISENQIEYITSAKSIEDVYFCISRNIIDYLFISTNQAFSSCVNLYGNYPYWIGLAAMATDPNRFLVFVSKGKVARFALRGYEMKHFKYASRSWGIIGDKDEVVMVGYYPHNNFSLEKLFEMTTGIKTLYDVIDFTSRFDFRAPYLQNGDYAMPYLDFIGFRTRTKEIKKEDGSTVKRVYIYYDRDGMLGFNAGIESDVDFDYAKCMDDFEYRRFHCDRCGWETSDEDDMYYMDNENICPDCYRENYFFCEECNYDRLTEYSCIVSGTRVCDNCFDNVAFVCETCNENFYNEEMYKDTSLCSECSKEFNHCGECNDFVHESDLSSDKEDENVLICDFCYDKKYRKNEKPTEAEAVAVTLGTIDWGSINTATST